VELWILMSKKSAPAAEQCWTMESLSALHAAKPLMSIMTKSFEGGEQHENVQDECV
jgi:hypothetical protein